MKHTKPIDYNIPGHMWNTKRIRDAIKLKLNIDSKTSSIRRLLIRAGLSWKKAKKILAKANPEKRRQYLELFVELYQEMVLKRRTLIYVDEAHIHQDVDLKYGWCDRSTRLYAPTISPGLFSKITWYGAYDFTNSRILAWSHKVANGENTVDFLQRISEWAYGKPTLTIIWDGAPAHVAKIAKAKAKELGIDIVPLPGYSPDLNPIEGLWKWLRDEVTDSHCHSTLSDLFRDCLQFFDRINKEPRNIAARLWPKCDLVDSEEKLRISA